MSSQLVNLNVGFGNKAIGDATKAQVDKFCFVGPAYAAESRATLGKMIIDLLPDNFGKVFFTNAGADANENAVKIARMYTGRKRETSCIGDVRYIGLFSSIELVKDRETKEPLVPYGKDPEGTMGKIIGMLKAKKFMTYSHENMIFVNPALIITEEQLREEMVKVDEVLTEVDSWLTI